MPPKTGGKKIEPTTSNTNKPKGSKSNISQSEQNVKILKNVNSGAIVQRSCATVRLIRGVTIGLARCRGPLTQEGPGLSDLDCRNNLLIIILTKFCT